MKANPKIPMKSKYFYYNLLSISLIGFIFTSFLYVFVIPLIYFFSYGSGAASTTITQQPLHLFIQEWGALCILLTGIALITISAARSSKLERVNAYVLAAILLTTLYMFRIPIGNLILNVCQ